MQQAADRQSWRSAGDRDDDHPGDSPADDLGGIDQAGAFSFFRRDVGSGTPAGVLATAGAYLFWNWGLAHMPASKAGVFLNLEPVVGSVLGIVILHERLAQITILGGALIVGTAVYFSLAGTGREGHRGYRGD